ncbi:MAG: inositol monophosphatase [Halobacteriales archaeon]|nr:inositol monophosphatase [Halobacteriales archaeon]
MSHRADPTDLGTLAERAARAGGSVALSTFRTNVQVNTKTNVMDSVTEADLAAQERVLDVLREADPDATYVAEEADAETTIPETGRVWIIDPIDGTNNYAVGSRLWATSVAAVQDGVPVAAVTHLPALEDTYTATDGRAKRNGDPVTVRDQPESTASVAAPVFGLGRSDRPAYLATTEALISSFGDLRRFGSGQTALAMVAAGELDGIVTTLRHSPWDTVAGAHLVRAGGGQVTDAMGDPWSAESLGLVASNGGVHEALLSAAQRGLEADGPDD